jgi:hypothetical protein
MARTILPLAMALALAVLLALAAIPVKPALATVSSSPAWKAAEFCRPGGKYVSASNSK